MIETLGQQENRKDMALQQMMGGQPKMNPDQVAMLLDEFKKMRKQLKKFQKQQKEQKRLKEIHLQERERCFDMLRRELPPDMLRYLMKGKKKW